MNNNDILRKLRYTLNLSDSKMMTIFELAERTVSRDLVCDWLKKEEDPQFKACNDENLAVFLNGLINKLRGKRDGEQPAPEKKLNNNLVFRKLRIAFNLKDDDIIALLDMANFSLSKSELSAFFRKPDHKHYRECKDQVLRNFLTGLQLKHRE